MVYDGYGDLDLRVLPEGNVIDYGYDGAGRLITVERTRPGQRDEREGTSYALDAAGNRIREDFQRWDPAIPPSGDWVTESCKSRARRWRSSSMAACWACS